MERAAATCYDWLMSNGYQSSKFLIFCGKGNNGGDGLVIARLLSQSGHEVTVHIPEFGHKGTDDFQLNLERLHDTGVHIKFIPSTETIPSIPPGYIIIDALLGSGLSRPIDGLTADLVNTINASGNEVIAIDVPSGISVDKSSKDNPAVRAKHTLSFQCYKIGFLLPENESSLGSIHILDIGLHPDFLKNVHPAAKLLDDKLIKSFFKKRKDFSHKGSFGHALLIVGSYGKMGAAVLSARACLRAGVGLCSLHIPASGYDIIQSTVPEAMVLVDEDSKHNTVLPAELDKYNVVGLGPGIGTEQSTSELTGDLFRTYRRPMVVDADALNIVAQNKNLLESIPKNSILTPHPKEFERLFGKTENDFDKINLAVTNAAKFKINIVLKGHRTLVATPDGKKYFNTTGNAGMATGGSGDVLTGIITSLLAQGYEPAQAAMLGVFIHGKAGDHAAKVTGMQSMIASDITKYLGKAFMEFET